jgi:hypothetical protein
MVAGVAVFVVAVVVVFVVAGAPMAAVVFAVVVTAAGLAPDMGEASATADMVTVVSDMASDSALD